METNSPQSLLSAYEGFLQMYYISLEQAESSHFKMVYGEQAQKIAVEYVNTQIIYLSKEVQKVRKMIGLLYE